MNQARAQETAERLNSVNTTVAAAAKAAGRKAQDIAIIAVSKTFDTEAIRPVIEAGHRLFGENRVAEAANKWSALKGQIADIELHLIGPLQTNKVRGAVELFDCIQTLDRPKLARVLAETFAATGLSPKLFIQVNTGSEPQKAGIVPDEADRLVEMCRQEYGLDIEGLMCIPPIYEEPSLHFALLEKIALRNGVAQLSMGMSADFEKAIHFGATCIRLGQAIFGPRA